MIIIEDLGTFICYDSHFIMCIVYSYKTSIVICRVLSFAQATVLIVDNPVQDMMKEMMSRIKKGTHLRSVKVTNTFIAHF